MAVKELAVEYGLGGEVCTAVLPETAVTGKSVREMLTAITMSPQRSATAQRTADTLREAMIKGRTLDVEIAHHTNQGNGEGAPIEMNDVLVKDKGESAQEENKPLTLRVSEHYRGGQ